MSNAYVDYWDDALGCALEAVGKFEALTRDERRQVAESLATSAENQSMAFGHDCIPNPKDSEIASLKTQHEREIAEWEAADLAYRTSVARRRGVEPNDVYIRNGRVVYDIR